jgi:tetratricopeptide (TPR) repeat protein
MLGYRRSLPELFLLSLMAGYFLLSLVYYASDRFLAAILPVSAILTVLTAQGLRSRYREHPRSAWRWGAVLLPALLLAGNPWLAWNARLEQGMGWYNQGVLQAQQGEIPAAQQSYERGLEIYPDFPPLLLNLGVIYARQGRLEESTRLFERGLQLDPDHPTLRKNLEINRQRAARGE